MQRAEVWWADLPGPAASEPGFRRPVLIVQSNEFNRSKINTIVVVAITSNLRLASAPGNVRLAKKAAGLNQESVVNVSQLVTLDKSFLTEKAGRLAPHKMQEVDEGMCLVLAL
ncbi:MAG: type II toxin-antitoxin system PemK/MazF family toxin [Candidatus Azotimanducaceae bacterium WSBS_2022_MAG_OTU7]